MFLMGGGIYIPNIHGTFILDDFPNLNGLYNFNQSSPSFNKLIKFLAFNNSGQLGRPISLFTFALQAEHWPNNASAFKFINSLIHLCTGILSLLTAQFLLKPFTASKLQNQTIAILITCLWLIQPIHVSVVLYVVQRMTLLMAFFSMLAISGYLYGKALSAQPKGLYISFGSIIIGTACAVFSKENGILVLLYIAVIEFTLYSNQTYSKAWKTCLWVFIYFPLLLGLIYFAVKTPEYISAHAGRDYTFTEHLLTETRILNEYIGKILLPQPDSFGLFFDDYTISKNLFSPLSTFFSSCFLVLLFLSALFLRHRQPVYSFGILWFFSGHILESTIIPLELYFEHRNYLPAFGIIFALCYYTSLLFKQSSSHYVKYSFTILTFLYFIGVYFIAFQEARLWNNSSLQAISWQKNHPISKRANALAAQAWLDLKQPLKADQQLQIIHNLDKTDNASYIMRLDINCHTNKLSATELSEIITKLKSTNSSNATVMSTRNLVHNWGEKKCSNLSQEYLTQILTIIYENTKNNRLKEHLASSFSLFFAYSGNYNLAVGILEKAIKEMPHATSLILWKIRWAVASQQYALALNWIKNAQQNNNKKRLQKVNFDNQLSMFENDIHEIIKNNRNKTNTNHGKQTSH